MLKRKSIPMGKSKRMFSRTASRTHWKNVKPRPQRGGIRL